MTAPSFYETHRHMPARLLNDMVRAYQKFDSGENSSTQIAERLYDQYIRPAEMEKDIARSDLAAARRQYLHSDLAHRVASFEHEKAEFNKLFGSPEQFQQTKDELNRREAEVARALSDPAVKSIREREEFADALEKELNEREKAVAAREAAVARAITQALALAPSP